MVEPSAHGLVAAGAMLSAARTEQNLGIESIAADLRLQVAIIKALEAGDEASLPATTFVRGYIRSYAHLLGLDATIVLAHLPAVQNYRARPVSTQVGPRSRRMMIPGKWFFRLLIVLALAAIVLYGMPVLEHLWSRSSEMPDQNSGQLVLPKANLAEHNAAPDSGLNSVTRLHTPPENLPEPIEEEPASRQDMHELPVPKSTEFESQPPVMDGGILKLMFSGDSWVVVEAKGKKLLVGTMRAGSEKTIRSNSTIRILLGNASSVSVTYNGKKIDTKPYQRGKVARLVLEP